MQGECCEIIEGCHADDCSGFDEVSKLLPSGRLWDINRNSFVGKYFRALGYIKTRFSQLLCNEWDIVDPCKDTRLLPYHAAQYNLPKCVEQSGAMLCEWIKLISDPACPVGSIGFYKKAIGLSLIHI